MRFVAVAAVLALAVAAAALGIVRHADAAPAAPAAKQALPYVNVSALDFSFRLSVKSWQRGTIEFRVRNRGAAPHDFKIAGKKTPILSGGGFARLRVRIARPGRYQYICTVPGHAAAGMKGVFTVR